MGTWGVADMALIATVAASLLITIWTDLRTRLVYPLVLLPGLLAALVVAASGSLGWQAAVLGGAGAAVAMALLVIASRRFWSDTVEVPIGSGEIMIAAIMGTMFGPAETFRVLFAGMIVGAVTAGILLLTRRAQRDDALPYGVFLCGAALVAMVV